ncbi:hypothetical protein [Powai lake megavirus]|uniref:DUF2828 domain-containing protein n=1 Tax=Powai lake megavirus TaxID=1842663 RepID=A0A167R7Y7_9VIRU|nr:hypothetical protein QJ849_gp240 [Powai lake megavirus]ANB50402.1 hypothetical protein [Powai lake megavirus]
MSNYTTTENGDKALLSSGNFNLDFFLRITRGASVIDYISAFNNCWSENREIAVKLLLNLRDIRSGKGEKIIPVSILCYLKMNLETSIYESILKEFIKHGYWKDLLKIAEIESNIPISYKNIKSENIEIKFFAQQLKIDHDILISHSDDKTKPAISLCAKWAPSEWSHYNKSPLYLANKIMKQLNMTPKQYRNMLTKLRNHLNILESLMSTQKFKEINFSKLPSVAQKKMKLAFSRDTNSQGIKSYARSELAKNYQQYLSDLQKGITKVNVKAIHPHELIHEYLVKNQVDVLIEAQWEAIKKQVLSSGAFKNVTAIVDVSGSMQGQPMDVSIALGILVAECTQGIYHGQVITFSETPTWHMLSGSSLYEHVKNLRQAEWGCNTNLKVVFDMILRKALDAKLQSHEMISTLFIFTDMQFDSCSDDDWISTFEYAKNKYESHGYVLPNIVCWNLRTSVNKTIPVNQNQPGYAMLSGFSPELLKCILNAEKYDPINIMMQILDPYEIPYELKNCLTTKIETNDLQFIDIFTNAISKSMVKKSFKK